MPTTDYDKRALLLAIQIFYDPNNKNKIAKEGANAFLENISKINTLILTVVYLLPISDMYSASPYLMKCTYPLNLITPSTMNTPKDQ